MEANARKVLAQAILALETEEDCNLLLEDLCTIKEIEDMAHRFEIAYLLSQGKTFIDVQLGSQGQFGHHQPGQPLPQTCGRLPQHHRKNEKGPYIGVVLSKI